ncbi:MAG: acyl-CoA/acyl-ACP dehydrogenase [bacterium]|nr:acyl-CoA/acyl-ACP dehydrogenase [bacterium]MCP5065409.1 acyl-CoA/acyl-ACP dehydrogenase [bacterium]
MIDFELGDELELVRATARDFAGDHLRPALRNHESARAPSGEARAAFTEVGFATLDWPEALGGSALGALARFVVLEELSAADAGAALALDPLGPALYALSECGGEEALARFGMPLLETAERAVLVWCGSGSRVRMERGRDTVRGEIPWVPSDAPRHLVLLDESGVSVVSEGFAATPLRGAGLRAAGAASVQLDDAPLAAHYPDAAGAARAVARARLYAAGMLVGIARESADYSREYALDRVAFGKPIAHHQALAFLIADMATAVDSARLLGWEAAWRIDAGHDADEPCASAFVEAAEQAMFVTPNGVQILGGHGFMQDYPVEKMMREARTLALSVGGIDAARDVAHRAILASEGGIALLREAG